MLTIHNPIVMTTPNEVLENLNLIDVPGVAVTARAPGCGARNVTVNGCDLSAFMLEDGADDFKLNGVTIANYNRLNKNGHAAIFCNPSAGPLLNLRGKNLNISNGNGNCVRLTSVVGFDFSECAFSGTTGLSAETLTFNKRCRHGRVRFCTFRFSWTDHALFWGDGHEDIEIFKNYFLNSGMANDGTHPAIGIQPNGGTVSAIDIHDNRFADDRATPLTACGVMTYGAGVIRWREPYRNLQWGCAYPNVWTKAAASTIVFEQL